MPIRIDVDIVSIPYQSNAVPFLEGVARRRQRFLCCSLRKQFAGVRSVWRTMPEHRAQLLMKLIAG